MKRRPNGASSIYQGKDGKWHGRVTVGVRDDGKPDRRHVERKTEAEVIIAVRTLEKDRDAGRVRKAGSPWTVEKWLTHWVEDIAAPSVKANTASGYRVAVYVHLNPGIGAHRLEKLTPEHIEKLTRRMQEKGSKPATAHQAFRTLRTALNEAMRRGHITQNPASLAKSPRLTVVEVEPYSVAEVQRILEIASSRRNGARWAIALAIGLRQGEALGLKWEHLDLDKQALRVRRNRLRPRYEHGCEGASCGKKAGYCRERKQTNADTDDTKSAAGRRVIGLPASVAELLRTHKAAQENERRTAAQLWRDDGWVFASPTGRPLNPNTDYHDWKKLLEDAGVRDGRLHDARHTAATVLMLLGVQERAAMDVMGWATTGMAARYQHVSDPVRADIAERVGDLLWRSPEKHQASASTIKEAISPEISRSLRMRRVRHLRA
jgi:integrase